MLPMDVSPTAVAALAKKSGLEIESELCGSSMRPTLLAGTRIRIRSGHGPYQPGDVVVFLAGSPIAHRVVGRGQCRTRAYVITRGDAHWFCDAPVAEDQILGIVTAQHDGRAWQPLRALDPPSGLASVLAWISHRSILAALSLSESLALLVARAGGSIARRCGGRG